MAEGAQGVEMGSIDYQALGRLGSNIAWKEDPRTLREIKEYPFSTNPDPMIRIQSQDVELTFQEKPAGETLNQSSFFQEYTELENGERTNAIEKAKKGSKRATELHLRDLNTQDALMEREKAIYEVLDKIGAKISRAERKLIAKGALTRTTETENYTFYITKREEVNASTSPLTKTVFLESGILVLMDNYLKEEKGYGLAEDHIALILSHEVSHSDPEAKTGYLNEEYCDSQGMILGAEAGYNPMAAVDVEDFFIWLLNEGDKKKGISISSHPDPVNRRAVLINILKDKDRILPNQTRKFSFVEEPVIDEVKKEMCFWQEASAERVLPLSQGEIINQIANAKDISQLSDVLVGNQLLCEAQAARVISGDRRFTNKVTLYQAVSSELSHKFERVNYKLPNDENKRYSPNPPGIDTVLIGVSGKNVFEESDMLIGGLSKKIAEGITNSELANEAQKVIADTLNDLSRVKVNCIPKHNDTGYYSLSEAEIKKVDEKETAFGHEQSDKAEKVYSYILNSPRQIDLSRLLSGDFSEDPTLSILLKDIGIKDFNNYLGGLQNSFQEININQNITLILSKRTNDLFINSKDLFKARKVWSKENVSDILEQTLPYRVAKFADRIIHPDYWTSRKEAPELSDELKLRVRIKLRSLSREYSEVPKEQELFYNLMNVNICSADGDSQEIAEQIASSSIQDKSIYGANLGTYSKFMTWGLDKSVVNLRFAPTLGGSTLARYIKGIGLESGNKTGSFQINRALGNLGGKLDFIRLYYGEGKMIGSRERKYGDKINFQINDRDLVGNLELISKRKNGIPVYGREIGKVEELEKRLDLIEENASPSLETFDKIIKASDYEPEYLSKLLCSPDIGAEEKGEYLLNLIKSGELSFNTLAEELKPPNLYSIENYKDGVEKYKVATFLLKKLPLYPTPVLKDQTAIELNEALLSQRIMQAKYGKFSESVTADGQETIMQKLRKMDLFEGLTGEAKAKAQFEFALDFVNEGGNVSISEGEVWGGKIGTSIRWGRMKNDGAGCDLIGIVERLNYNSEYVEEKINKLIEQNSDRFTDAEKDKWMSLIAFSKQHGFNRLSRYYMDDKSNTFVLGEDGKYTTYDLENPEHLIHMLDQIVLLPECSFRDQAISDLVDWSTIDKGVFVDGQMREYFEQKLSDTLISGFSKRGLNIDQQFGNQTWNVPNEYFIPGSEVNAGDPIAGFYFSDDCFAAHVWEYVVQQYASKTIRTPLGVDYRKNTKFEGLDKDFLERTVLYDRLRYVQKMPQEGLREALTVFSVQTAYDNLLELDDQEGFKRELSVITSSIGKDFVTSQARQKLFDICLKLELGGVDSKINSESIRQKFPERQDFINFVTTMIPEKTAFRDSYVILASESYPFKVEDIDSIRGLMFSVDYGTQKKGVRNQRAAFELGRIIKGGEGYEKSQAGELVLWMVDKDLQIRSMDEFLRKTDGSPIGKRLIQGSLSALGVNSDESRKLTLEQKATLVALKGALSLPYPIKKKLIGAIMRSPFNERELQFVTKAGMPKAFHNSYQYISGININSITFNSLLGSSGLENPTTKNIFFDLMLGEKGLLEEPVESNSDNFSERLRENFGGSEMHKFIDDLVDTFVRKGGLNQNEKTTMRIVAHSLLERMSPERRSTVLYNLISELPKIDFTEPDKGLLKSQIMTTALSSFGVLGAKLGQTDEVIPKGWGESASSLKHSTEPMPFMAVADIFRQEGLSDQYKIVSSAGAASTACGYIVESPSGEEQFAKVVRPEVVLDYREDFNAVNHMLQTLQKTGTLKAESGPIIDQLKKLVEEELQTGKEINNVLNYVNAETDEQRQQREGIRAEKMPLQRVGNDGLPIVRPSDSLLILAEPLGSKQGFTELSRAKTDPVLSKEIDFGKVNTIIVKDFLYRALELGNWHTDPHEGNIMVNKEGIVKKEVSNKDLVWIDFGQVGTVDSDQKRGNAARFLVGLGLYDRGEVAKAIYEGITDKTGITEAAIRSELSIIPNQLQDSAVKALAKYKVEEYVTNFLKASINILPYLRSLPKIEQYNLISPYIPEEIRGKLRTRMIETFIKK